MGKAIDTSQTSEWVRLLVEASHLHPNLSRSEGPAKGARPARCNTPSQNSGIEGCEGSATLDELGRVDGSETKMRSRGIEWMEVNISER